MKIKVQIRKNKYPEGTGKILFSVKFKITELDDEDILKISQLSRININMNPASCGLSGYNWRPIAIGSEMKWNFSLKSDKNNLINFNDFENIELSFSAKEDAIKYKEFILEQFTNEIKRISNIDNIVEKEEEYEIKADEGIKKIYEGAQKLLDKNSPEYKQIIEKNREAWKKLADM